jgi:hypothetical protein
VGKNKSVFVAALMATTLISIAAVRAENQTPLDQKKATPQMASAEKGFDKLSSEGSGAYYDLSLARLAIFEGRIDDAKKFINRAEAAFNKARTDESVFVKAESALRQPVKGTAAPAPADDSKTAQFKTPITWLPIEGSITIDEDYTVDPAKTAAVAEANKSLKNGDRKGAVKKLELANIKVSVVLGVMPLEETIGKVHQAAALINDGKYYEAGQYLRLIQASERFDAFGVEIGSSN